MPTFNDIPIVLFNSLKSEAIQGLIMIMLGALGVVFIGRELITFMKRHGIDLGDKLDSLEGAKDFTLTGAYLDHKEQKRRDEWLEEIMSSSSSDTFPDSDSLDTDLEPVSYEVSGYYERCDFPPCDYGDYGFEDRANHEKDKPLFGLDEDEDDDNPMGTDDF
ncbi:hypothetical protein ACUUL3_04795 [Thiovibrio sp. JS02]